MNESSITPTPRQLRALTHPVRLRMLGMLRNEGPATATSLAAQLRINTGATSYHLRQLAEHGFIEDDPDRGQGRGTGRERWWRATATTTRVDRHEPRNTDAANEVDAYLQSVVTVYAEQLQRAMEERPLLSDECREASSFSDWQPRLTPHQARVLIERIDDLLSGIDDDDSDDALAFTLNVNIFPRPGQAGRDLEP